MDSYYDTVPSTMEEAVATIIASLSECEKTNIRVQETQPPYFHHTVGTAVRNGWSFWEDTPLRRDAIKRWRLAHADDLSGMLFDWVWATVHGEKFDIAAYCARVHAHWAEAGTTSCEQVWLHEDGMPYTEDEKRERRNRR